MRLNSRDSSLTLKRKRDETMRLAEEAQRVESERRQLDAGNPKNPTRGKDCRKNTGKAEAECTNKLPEVQAVVKFRKLEPKIKFKPPYPRSAATCRR